MMKMNYLTLIALTYLCSHNTFANQSKPVTHKPKIPSIHMTLNKDDCYTAPAECLLVVTPSKWSQGHRTYDIEKVCDYNDAQLTYNHDLTLKDQLAERKFLGQTFCHGIVTLSDMTLPFTKFDSQHKYITDANDGIILLNTFRDSINDIESDLNQMSSLATQAALGVYSQTQLDNLNSEFQSLSYEINRIANVTQFNGISILNTWDEYVMQIPIHKNTYINFIPVNLTNATTGSSGLNIASLSITSVADANAALQPLINALAKMTQVSKNIEHIRPQVETAARKDATITTVDLTGSQFVVHQESSS